MSKNKNPFINEGDNDAFTVNRQFKSSLFAYLLSSNKENTLSVCNCVEGSNFTNAEDIQYEMLDNALFVKIRNDVSFIFDKSIKLYEHQSTYNPNMPLRGFLYHADLYNRIVDKSMLYGRTLVKIPFPKYYVFYNGVDRKNIPDKIFLRLSDAFLGDEKPEGFEWTATMININSGHNKELMEKCKILSDYSTFIETVRKFGCEYELKDAILMAIEECIKNDVLKDVLLKFRNEVAAMTWTEFDEEAYEKAIQARLDAKDSIIESMNKEIANKDAEIANKDAEIANKDAEIADKDAEIADKDVEIANKDAEIADKAAEIAGQKAEIAKLKALLEQS